MQVSTLRLRGGAPFHLQSLISEGFQGFSETMGGPSTQERILALINENLTRSLNMTVAQLIAHPSIRGRKVEPEIVEALMHDYWYQGVKDSYDAVERSLCRLPSASICFSLVCSLERQQNCKPR